MTKPENTERWELEIDDLGWNRWTCPCCGYYKRTNTHVWLGWNYCPMCGKRLEGGK